ncbi:alpha/beta fold hydrolase [Thalassococcus sp. BH17M4-6]|uniref:alpha/beta fold hydrolase n=1 Tax=Thalassococcus sp. BH17M4-6 TaxID=3413148 RepID=UPI003BCF8A3C
MQGLHLDDMDALLRWHDLPGQGPALVCLPALSFAAAPNFLPLVTQPVLNGVRRILPDYPGSGISPPIPGFSCSPRDHAGLIARLLDHLELGPAVIFGHSMGGTVAMYLALDRPDLVAHVLVAEGNLTPGGGPASSGIARQECDAFVRSGFAERQAKLLRAALCGNATAGRVHAARIGADPATLHGTATGLVDLDPGLKAAFLSSPVPRTFVYGAQSLADSIGAPDVPDPEALRTHGVGTEVIDGAGHLMTHDNPAAVADLLVRVLREVAT